MKPNRPPQPRAFQPNHLAPLSRDTTEKGLIYLFALSLLLIILYGYLLIDKREIPPFLTGLIGFTVSPLVYTIMPKFLQLFQKYLER
jgi:hypothetical protein